MKLLFFPSYFNAWRCVTGWGLAFAVWLLSRNAIWLRMERDWLLTGYTRYSGLGGNAPIACPPPGEVVLVRLIMHPLTGSLIFTAGTLLVASTHLRNRGRARFNQAG